MNKIQEKAGLTAVEFLNIDNVNAFTDDVPNSLSVIRLDIAGGYDWEEIPFIPETAIFHLERNHNQSGSSFTQVVNLELDGNADDFQSLCDRLDIGWYLMRITDSNNNKYVLGLLDMPGKFNVGQLRIGPNQLENISNGLSFTANTTKRILKVV